MTERLDEFDWSQFTHARGPATDTPGHLRALVGKDARAFVTAYTHLWSDTLPPDGGAWSVTAPVALVVTELLDDPRLGPDDPSMRDAMLAYLHRVAIVGDLGEEAEALRARNEHAEALACYDAAPEILAKVLPHLSADRARQRVCAAAAVGRLARHPAAAAQRQSLISRLEKLAEHAERTYDRATFVFAIGDLGGAPRRWLDDPSPGVRGSAALAEALAGDDDATKVLLALARAPRAFAASFGEIAPPIQVMVPPWADLITEAVVRRVDDIGKLFAGALAAVTVSQRSTFPSLLAYLRAFFPTGDPRPRASLQQRALAEAIAERDELWCLPEETRAGLFAPLGLSTQREGWTAMAVPERPLLPILDYSTAQILVLEGFMAIRRRPGMYFGVGRTNPDLPKRVVQGLRSEYAEAVASGLVESFTAEIETPTRLVLDVHGHLFPWTGDTDGVNLNPERGWSAMAWPVGQVYLTSALCRSTGVRVWVDGRNFGIDYVDGMALGAPRELGVDASRTGYRVTFELDTDWFPAGHRFSDQGANSVPG